MHVDTLCLDKIGLNIKLFIHWAGSPVDLRSYWPPQKKLLTQILQENAYKFDKYVASQARSI